MTQLRLYTVRTGPSVDECDGCREPIPPHTPAVMREDRALFCVVTCALEHDDAPVTHRVQRVAL